MTGGHLVSWIAPMAAGRRARDVSHLLDVPGVQANPSTDSPSRALIARAMRQLRHTSDARAPFREGLFCQAIVTGEGRRKHDPSRLWPGYDEAAMSGFAARLAITRHIGAP